MINHQTACHLVDTAARAMQANSETFHAVLDEFPAPVYVTDAEGTITYFSRACVEFVGRRPVVGIDKWCVTWKIYTPEGEPVPHEECPMAVAVRERRAVRDVEAVAERPDGTRVHFVPYPTPLFEADGTFAGAVNLLIDVSEQRKPEYLREQAERCRRLSDAIHDLDTAAMLSLMAARYDEQAEKLAR